MPPATSDLRRPDSLADDVMREELAALFLQRARVAGAVGVVVHVVFTLTDWFQFADGFVTIRLLTSVGFALLLAAASTAWGGRHIRALVFTGFFCALPRPAL